MKSHDFLEPVENKEPKPLAPLRVSFSQQLMDVHQFRTEVRVLSLEISMVYDTAM